MNDWQSPLVLAADIFPGMCDEEIAFEVGLMFQRSNAISQAIRGEMSVDDLAELVREQDYDIDEWANACDKYGESW